MKQLTEVEGDQEKFIAKEGGDIEKSLRKLIDVPDAQIFDMHMIL